MKRTLIGTGDILAAFHMSARPYSTGAPAMRFDYFSIFKSLRDKRIELTIFRRSCILKSGLNQTNPTTRARPRPEYFRFNLPP